MAETSKRSNAISAYNRPALNPPQPMPKSGIVLLENNVRRRKYSRTRVLLIHWQDDKPSCRWELEELEKFFFHRYGFRSTYCALPLQGQHDHLVQSLEDFKAKSNDDNELLIVVYSGHGGYDELAIPPTLVWAPTSSGNQCISWNDVQRKVLFKGGKDIFLVLDCCCAEAAWKETFKARRDTIAACEKDDTTPVPGPYSFTHFFMEAAASFQGPFTTQALCEKIRKLATTKPYYNYEPSDADHDIYLEPLYSVLPPCKGPKDNPGTRPIKAEIEEERPGLLQVTDPSSGTQIQVRTGAANPIILQEMLGQGIQAYQTLSAPTSSRALAGFKRRDRSFFVVGRVFLIAWADPTATSTAAPLLRPERTAGVVRSFVVVSQGQTYCIALPIVSYNGRGVAAPGVIKAHHGIIFSGRNPPSPLPGEVTRRGEANMRAPVRCDFDERNSGLDPASRIDYSKSYVIDYSIPVKRLGRIREEYLQVLLAQLQAVLADQGRLTTGLSYRNVASSARAIGPTDSDTHFPALATSRTQNLELQQQAARAMQRLRISGYSQEDAARLVHEQFQRMHAQQVHFQRQQITGGSLRRVDDSEESEEDDEEDDSDESSSE